MQIDRRPSRGPYVAALVCLLTLCLTIPVYWQSKAERERKQREAAAAAMTDYAQIAAELRGNCVRPPRAQYRLYQFPGYERVDTLDELLSELANRPEAFGNARPDVFAELLGRPEQDYFDPAELHSGVVGQYFARLIYDAGCKFSEMVSVERATSSLAQFAFGNQHVEQRHDSLPSYSLILSSPSDRIAMIERPTTPFDVESFPTPWCVPTALLDRLEVLAAHPYSADWALRTSDEVRALTESAQPRTGAVTAQLGRLQALATEAVDLANETGDDLLRAELLRAHWGLARRLECWALMRDIAVASVAENRFAARTPWIASASVYAGQGTLSADLQSLSGDLETYERDRTPRMARAIVERQRQLALANDSRQRELANQIEQNYRNANVRLALSAELLERFINKHSEHTSTVRDRIAGTPVRGQSLTTTENKVHLHPDPQRWNVDLESTGTVDSQTVSDAGSVQVCTRGSTEFVAEKSIVVERDGVLLGESSVDAHSNGNTLTGIRSDFDWVPLVNGMVRSRARDEYRQKQSRARLEIERKVARRVEEQIDERAGAAVSKAKTQMREQVTGPLSSAGVEVTPIEMSTTEKRLVARLRVAGDEQLAGHTPRPRAPADSLASVQVHESAITNAAVSLDLDGKRFTAQELQTLMREKFSRTNQPAATVIDAETVFDFATDDAVRFRIADQKLELILSLREVDFEGDTVRNFRVHAFYVPVINGLEAEFVRDGGLGIEGRIGTGDRARMHGVFNKVLSEDRKLPIVRLNDPSDKRLVGLMITQLVLEDGWIGLAIGPGYAERTAERTRMLR
jgi:hypothetical protein